MKKISIAQLAEYTLTDGSIHTIERNDIETLSKTIAHEAKLTYNWADSTTTGFYNFICEYSAIPLVNYHLESLDTVKRLVIYGFLGFAIFFVAIMNYMLIAIAAMSRRAKMVGVHKCSGASTGNVFGMFMMETGIIVLLSVVISLFIIINAQEVIEDLLSVTLPALFTWETLWVPALTIQSYRYHILLFPTPPSADQIA